MNVIHLQVTDILTQVFNTFLIAEVRNDRRCSSPLTLLYMQFVRFGRIASLSAFVLFASGCVARISYESFLDYSLFEVFCF